MSEKKYLSVSYSANMIIFVFFISLLIIDLISNRNEVANVMSFITQSTRGTDDSISQSLTLLVFAYFIPFSVYLLKLNISLIAFENTKEYYQTYLSKLHVSLKVIEWIIRYFLYIMLLLGISKFFLPFSYLTEQLFELFNVKFSYFLMNNNQNPYFSIYDGFQCIKDFVFFPFSFYIWLLIWDIIVFSCNLICRNKLNIKEFMRRFVVMPLVGLAIWTSLVLLLFTNSGHKILIEYYAFLISCLAIVLLVYLVYVIKSTKPIFKEARESIFIIHTSQTNHVRS